MILLRTLVLIDLLVKQLWNSLLLSKLEASYLLVKGACPLLFVDLEFCPIADLATFNPENWHLPLIYFDYISH